MEHKEHQHEPVGYGIYILVWLALLVFTGLTVAVAGIHLPNIAVLTALSIAAIKTVLVVVFFMHLKYEDRVFKIMLFVATVTLAVIALVMAGESVSRLYHPQNIHFNEAIFVAVLGLAINLVSAFLLQDSHGHSSNEGHHHDHNLRAAYLHVLADALTSVLAIIALFSGKYFGLNWMDPVMGIVGALVISRWSWGLLRDTSSILLDQSMEGTDIIKIKKILETDSDNRIADVHIWKVGPDHYAAIISIVTHYPKPPEHYKRLLKDLKELELPQFDSEEEEAEYWANHSTAPYWDKMEPEEFQVAVERPRKKLISIRLDSDCLERIKVVANRKGIPYQTLIQMWLKEKIQG